MKEFLELLNMTTIDLSAVQAVEEKYHCVLTEEMKQIVSYQGEKFYDDWRVLSLKEILGADEYLGIDFPEKEIIPVIDLFDNDFILFDVEKGVWIKMNIVDECIFDSSNTLDCFV